MKSCAMCVKNDVCKFLHGSTLERSDRISNEDLVRALTKLGRELGEKCRSYLEIHESGTQLFEKSEYTLQVLQYVI